MIELRNVKKKFEKTFAVDDVSFVVKPGNILCLIGVSGCGKTTTLRMINRLIETTSGDILLFGKNIMDQDPIELRRSIGYVVQHSGLLPHLTVRENVRLLEDIKKSQKNLSNQKVTELLDLVGLNPQKYENRYPNELSGGEKQRVGIARALIGDPNVLLMDEPFGALDPITRKHLQNEFWELNTKLKKTTIIVTHDLSEAFRLGDWIVLMNKGKIIQQGIKKEFLDNPSTPFVKEFVQSYVEGIL